MKQVPPPSGCRGAGLAGPLARPLEGERVALGGGNSGDQFGKQARDDAVQDRTAHGPPEPVDLEALQHGADEPEQQGVDDDEEETERDDRDGQCQQHQHRLDQHVDLQPFCKP